MPEGLLPARTDLKVLITVNPQYSGYHRYRVRCSVTDDSGQHNEIMVAEITAMAEYPRLRIADCRKLNTSHDRVWRAFDIVRINKYLSYPNLESTDKGTLGDFDTLVKELTKFDLNFGNGVLGKDSTTVHWTLENVGNLQLDWKVDLCSNAGVEIENWQDVLTPSPMQQHYFQIIENAIFDLQPSSGTIPPGGKQVVT